MSMIANIMLLSVAAHNVRARRCYESLGFSLASKAHGHLQGRDVFMGRRV